MKKIQHLYWRAGFGLSPNEWQRKKNWSIEQGVKDLFEQVARHTKMARTGNEVANLNFRNLSQAERQRIKRQEKKKTQLQNIAWLEQMTDATSSDLVERISLFWHGHFACETKIAHIASAYVNTIRRHALGNFRDLVVAIAKDAAMIRYLNNQQNRKRKPNENFARELMELFTIGRGNYTEKDIKEAARAFTGWSSTKGGEFIFNKHHHDFGRKTFMGKSGNFNGEDIIDIILQKRATATFICRKIYAYFVNEDVDERRVQHLANLFYRSNYNIKTLMQHIFSADWFYDKKNMGTKIKSPIELIVGMTRQLGMVIENKKALTLIQRALGQVLFNPPNVAGWPGGKTWIDNSTLMLRLNLAGLVFQASDANFKIKYTPEDRMVGFLKILKSSLDMPTLLQLTKGQSDAQTFATLSDYLLQAPVRLNEKDLKVFTPHSSQLEYVQMLTMRLLSLPEYQLC